ncbi:MAG: hypothetical protein KatS3mg060_2550 [Dehalococcoidia bacterium]|jgi:hypothetical protein|nr:MAG: hypothetical protein KatS3mg060_2550 [Dehalococcoidia bacterium]
MAVEIGPFTIWNEREAVPGNRALPVANALLFLPAGQRLGDSPAAALLFHRWAGYHDSPVQRALGTALAERGVPALSFGLRRRGLEGALLSVPDDDVADTSLALDWLFNAGYRDLYLVGEQIGALSAARFLAKKIDPRVRGLVLIRPLAHPRDWLAGALGTNRYDQLRQESGRAALFQASTLYLVDEPLTGPDGEPFPLVQYAGAILAW